MTFLLEMSTTLDTEHGIKIVLHNLISVVDIHFDVFKTYPCEQTMMMKHRIPLKLSPFSFKYFLYSLPTEKMKLSLIEFQKILPI